jgi:tryptophanyl-tRNA synthetase
MRWVNEKYLIGKGDRTVEEYEHFARENAKDIIAVGFDPDRTFIFSDYGSMGGEFYRNITRVAKVRTSDVVYGVSVRESVYANAKQRINRGTADACFGFDASTNIGKVSQTLPNPSPNTEPS